jgi:hypothetical protein
LPFLVEFLPEEKRQRNPIEQRHFLAKFWGSLRAHHGKALLKLNRLSVKFFSPDVRAGFTLPVCEDLRACPVIGKLCLAVAWLHSSCSFTAFGITRRGR